MNTIDPGAYSPGPVQARRIPMLPTGKPDVAAVTQTMLLAVRPLVRCKDGHLHYIKPVDPRTQSFAWDPVLTKRPKYPLVPLLTVRTLHTYGFLGFFKPSVAEVLAAMPTMPDGAEAAAFEVVKSPDCNAKGVEVTNGLHVAWVTSYGWSVCEAHGDGRRCHMEESEWMDDGLMYFDMCCDCGRPSRPCTSEEKKVSDVYGTASAAFKLLAFGELSGIYLEAKREEDEEAAEDDANDAAAAAYAVVGEWPEEDVPARFRNRVMLGLCQQPMSQAEQWHYVRWDPVRSWACASGSARTVVLLPEDHVANTDAEADAEVLAATAAYAEADRKARADMEEREYAKTFDRGFQVPESWLDEERKLAAPVTSKDITSMLFKRVGTLEDERDALRARVAEGEQAKRVTSMEAMLERLEAMGDD